MYTYWYASGTCWLVHVSLVTWAQGLTDPTDPRGLTYLPLAGQRPARGKPHSLVNLVRSAGAEPLHEFLKLGGSPDES